MENTTKQVPASTTERPWHGRMGATADDQNGQNPTVGRYPPNLLLSHAEGCVCEGTRRVVATSIHGESTATRGESVHAEMRPEPGQAERQPRERLARRAGEEVDDRRRKRRQ